MVLIAAQHVGLSPFDGVRFVIIGPFHLSTF